MCPGETGNTFHMAGNGGRGIAVQDGLSMAKGRPDQKGSPDTGIKLVNPNGFQVNTVPFALLDPVQSPLSL